MSRHTPVPDRIPPGMTHVGWRCTQKDHTCLRALSDTNPPDDMPSRWEHSARWAPVFGYSADLEGD